VLQTMSASKVRAPPKPRQPRENYITKVGQKKKEPEEVVVVEEAKPEPKLFEGQREYTS